MLFGTQMIVILETNKIILIQLIIKKNNNKKIQYNYGLVMIAFEYSTIMSKILVSLLYF